MNRFAETALKAAREQALTSAAIAALTDKQVDTLAGVSRLDESARGYSRERTRRILRNVFTSEEREALKQQALEAAQDAADRIMPGIIIGDLTAEYGTRQ